mmetsp:Transcript_106196/g.331284  ORF Transcript_106196/g.331284 Transcript_106196/m.331284 type:complete len:457 (-) Transcript_106196:65-1435(-)
MPPLLEVALERPPAPVGVVPADLALVLDAKAVQLVEPEGDRLAVPAQRQVQRVVDRPVLVVVRVEVGAHVHAVVHEVVVIVALVLVQFHLVDALALLLLQVLHRLLDGVAQEVVPLRGPALQPRYSLVLLLNLYDELLLLVEGQLLHLLYLLLVELAGLVRLHAALVVEEPVRRQAEEPVLVRGILPAQDTPVSPALLELLVELRLKLLDAHQRLRSQQDISEVGDDGFQVASVLLLPVLAVAREVVELVEGLQPAYVVELVVLLLHGLLHQGIIQLEVRRPPLQACEGRLLEMVFSVHGDLLDVDVPNEVLVHIHPPPKVLLAGEDFAALVGLEGALVEPLRALQLWEPLVHGEAPVVVLDLLDLVVETRPDVPLLLVAALSRQRVDVVGPHAVLVLIDVNCCLGLQLGRFNQVLQGVLAAHRLLGALALVHEDQAHRLLYVLDVLMSRAQLLQN